MTDTLLSVGIDIGTSTTQLIFSKIKIENRAAAYAVPKMEITEKNVIYRSNIYFTPLKSAYEIDTGQILSIIKQEYARAGFSIHDPNTGAVIITGETARKENAKSVLKSLSDFSGDFVVATAGADLESILSGKGAGTDLLSEKHHTIGANLDIGGGTTNIALFNRGTTTDTACFDIGGRLIRLDAENKITYISPKLKQIIQNEQIKLTESAPYNMEEGDKLLAILTDALCQCFGIGMCRYFELLITNKALSTALKPSFITFSGGVADCIYNMPENPFQFGDVGPLLAAKIKNSPLCQSYTVLQGKETLRATVVGAGCHTTEISGSTIFYHPGVLPLKNMPVIQFENIQDFSTDYEKKQAWFDRSSTTAIAFKGMKSPSFRDIAELATVIINKTKTDTHPLVLVFEEDMGKAVGYYMQSLAPQRCLVCIDGIALKDGDYIDIGNPASAGTVLPVVIKTLLFQ